MDDAGWQWRDHGVWPARAQGKYPPHVGLDHAGHWHVARDTDDGLAVSYHRQDRTYEKIHPLPFAIIGPMCAPIADGRFLVASGGSQYVSGKPPQPSAVLLDQGGAVQSTLHTGNCVNDMQIDDAARIWASFSDQGVYGNHGWNHPGPPGLGAGGLVCLDTHGAVLWQHNAPDAADQIDECYALNVTPEAVYFYFYSAFRIGRITDDFRVTYHDVPVSGAHAFATDGNRFAFTGGFREDTAACHVCDMGHEGLNAVSRPRLVLPDDWPGDAQVWATARGPWLLAYSATRWARYHIEDLY